MLRYYLVKGKYQVYITAQRKQFYFGSFSKLETIKSIENEINLLKIVSLEGLMNIKGKYVKQKLLEHGSKLLSDFSDLLNEYHSRNTINPDNLPSGSNKKVWWQCPVDNAHIWQATIQSRVYSKSGCPFCDGKLVCKSNCLAVIYPTVAAEWHPTKNGSVTPWNVTAGSRCKKYWWKCSKISDHEWQSNILNRTLGKSGCSCCEGYTIVNSNCLATTYPTIVAEWHPTKNDNLTPYNVGAGSRKKVWWICKKKNHQLYLATVDSRTRGGSGCPTCNQSKGERRIEAFLLYNNMSYKKQYTFPNCKDKKLLKFDFAVFVNGLIKLIEYQGELHYREGRFRDADIRLKDTKRKDKIKKDYCKLTKTFCLEIKFTDFHNIEKILRETLQ